MKTIKNNKSDIKTHFDFKKSKKKSNSESQIEEFQTNYVGFLDKCRSGLKSFSMHPVC